MPDAAASNGKPPPTKCILGAFAFQAVALLVVGWINRHALNPDAVAYLRIAGYYADGNTALAVSDYWSPLISWLLVPFLKTGMPPLMAARVFMGLSAIIFLFGSLQIFRRFNLSRQFLCWGVWIAAIVSAPWSTENITPDLLMAGLVSFAFAMMMADNWPAKRLAPFVCGVLWGVAYLCKAIALPLAILASLGLACLWWRKRPDAGGKILRNLVLTIIGAALLSAPWITVISAKAGRLTISTSAALNHSLIGPTVTKQIYLLDQGFHKPDAGRITRWENPPPPYPDWSPFANWTNAAHQLRVVLVNIPVVLAMLAGVCLAFPVVLLAAIWRCRRKQPSAVSNLSWAALPMAALGVLYLPNYLLIYEQRYFYATFPFLVVLTAGLFLGEIRPGRHWAARYGGALLALALLLPTFARDWIRPGTTHMAGDCAQVLAEKIRAANLSDPISGSGKLPGGRTGLYLAFLLDEPWHGDKPSATAADFKTSGANLVVVNRGSGVARELESDAGFQNLDSQLFDSEQDAGRFPLQLFKLLPAERSATP